MTARRFPIEAGHLALAGKALANEAGGPRAEVLAGAAAARREPSA